MIIVSQDKNRIINFDNITRIEYEKCNGENYIVYDLTNGCYGSLGTYKTEERAKEVLSEITKAHKIFETYKVTTEEDTRSMLIKKINETNCSMFVYYMPEV